ncbi:unnamed protein product [Vicia faba]|uniref:Thioredoxin domain-containing protein n=1 Tax=Vicia faba TaxID=3906 RepID=A0AAV1APX2_VICFA|nr:unnamed protein product [Vicia faba]
MEHPPTNSKLYQRQERSICKVYVPSKTLKIGQSSSAPISSPGRIPTSVSLPVSFEIHRSNISTTPHPPQLPRPPVQALLQMEQGISVQRNVHVHELQMMQRSQELSNGGMSLHEYFKSPEAIQSLLSDRDKLCQLLEQQPKLMQMLQESHQTSTTNNHSRSLSSTSASPGLILVDSAEEFDKILSKVQDDSLHAIFYFTAVWCGPCRFISPIVGELSKKYPNVATYKIDIDQEAIQDTLSRLQITSVPTLHFFQNGKKTDELIGADVARLNHITEKLFKKD